MPFKGTKMNIFASSMLFGGSIFICIFIFHVLLWRVFSIKREILTLLFLFLLLPLIALAMNIIFGLFSFSENFLIALFYFSISLAYIQTFPAIKENIPSFKIMLYVHSRSLGGQKNCKISAKQIEDALTDESLMTTKIQELKGDGLMILDKDGFSLTIAGKYLALIFYRYRALLGLKEGRG
jgi:hypothetical protein